MKKLIVIVLVLSSTMAAWAQEDFVPKFDGTKYYMLIYDEDENEKVLSYKAGASWNAAITYSDYFDGSSSQLWVFEEPDEHPGYINVRNLDESLSDRHFLKSWNWYAYMESQTGAREGDQEKDLELVFRFKHMFDGWQALETIEKPAGLYGVDYTPGPDALNIDAQGVASFSGVKTSSITPENAAYKVFKPVEFDPLALFVDAIERGQSMYDDHPGQQEIVLYDLFYILEQARAVRVFETDAEMLAYQPVLDEALVKFTSFLDLAEAVDSAKAFIVASATDAGVKSSFNALITRVESFMGGSVIDYNMIPGYLADLEEAANLVNAILDAETYHASLAGLDDPRLADGMDVAITDAKAVLAAPDSMANAYNVSVSILSKMQEFLDEVIVAIDLIETTQEFEEAKQELEAGIDAAIDVAGTSGISLQDLTDALIKLQSDIKAFKKALEAGDTPILLENPGFEDQLNRWNSVSDDPGIPYLQNDGVDGSVNMAVWKGSDYHVKAFQSLSGIPDGKYEVSMMAVVSEGDRISLFAESAGDTAEMILPFVEWSYTSRAIEIEVTGGMLIFGIKGSGTDNFIPANVWGIFDDFEVEWLSSIEIQNPGFESLLEGWTSDSDTEWIPYTQDDGVDGSKNMAFWNSVDYHVTTSQTIPVPDGKYEVSVWAKISQADYISLFAESGADTASQPLPFGDAAYAKSIVRVNVTGGSLTFGVRGSGENNLIPANVWGTFDNFEVVRLPDIDLVNPGFEDDFLGWTKDSDTEWMPYIENKGVDGSKSVTFWQSVDYHVSTFQTISSLNNGEFEISAMTFSPNDDSYMIFGESGGIQEGQYIPASTGLVKNKVTTQVTDNTLILGMRGSGEGNFVPANHWIVFDNFEVILKSILPVYDSGKSGLTKEGVTLTGVITEEKPEQANVIWWQEYDLLHVRSDDPIVALKVYSISGVLIAELRPYSRMISLPLESGFYMIHVKSENGFLSLKKVVVR